ncbi:PepSY domain-containing protein [Segnochrobactraceae bacterium EtOH-i3]
MLRRLHALPGIVLALGLTVTALSGAVLSVQPALDRATVAAIPAGTSVADLAGRVAARHETVSKVQQRADGRFTATVSDGATRAVEVVDPATGAGLGPYQTSEFTRWITSLHRAFLAGDAGRIAAAVSALMMLGLSVSGLMLMARRLGGWSALLKPVHGRPAERLHGELGRLAVVGLVLSSLTGLWMSAGTFSLLPESIATSVVVTGSGGAAAPAGSLAGLQAVPLAELRSLSFPDPQDPADVFTLTTEAGEAQIDAATGAVLAMTPASLMDRVNDTIRMLHTGRGAWALGLLLGLSALAVPVLGVTGTLMWARRRAARPRLAGTAGWAQADTIILVGSDGNSTWGFAATLQAALTTAGHRVHVRAMNDVAALSPKARRLLVLAATHGDGAAPASASAFLSRIDRLGRRVPVAVLGFGDRSFPHFCAFAEAVSAAFTRRGFPLILPMKRIDRRSAQEFAQWGRDLGAVLGQELTLEHVAERPQTFALELIEREDYGAAVGAPVAILRFRLPAESRRRLPDFLPGDLLGILPPGADMPRFYSLASAACEELVEICVRRRADGLCSPFLHALEPGDRIDAFVRANPVFRPVTGRAPLILIGAGAGIGPLAGLVRGNDAHRPVHLYWGGRSPASDFLYEHELAEHLAEKKLTSLSTAFSRDPAGAAYVQDRLTADAPRLRELLRDGAQILVCGGRDMADGVTRALEPVARSLGLDLQTLKSAGRYVEDVY